MMAQAVTTDPLDRVIEEFHTVFKNKGLVPPVLCTETILDGSLGLESLDFAEVVMRLEQALGKDPFATGTIPDLKTLGDFTALYRDRPDDRLAISNS
jgi:acyl carrier protein